jgi:O-antigen/teichoic acid export membrane protein
LGIIRKQGIQGSISLYIGVFVGFITTALLFPKILKEEEIGLINTLVSYSTVFAQFATLGFNSVIIRNFSYFRNYQNKHNHFFFLVFWVMALGSLLSVVAFYILKPLIIRQNLDNALLFVQYIDYLVPLIIFTLVFYVLDAYYTVLYKTVRGIILKEVLQKIFILLALYLYFIELYSFNGFTIGYVISLSIPGVIMFIFILVEGEWVFRPKFDYISREMGRSMFSVGAFGILTSLVGSANMQIDRAMASSMIGLQATGIYTTVINFASLIRLPSRSVLKIASAIIAEAWKREDTEEISKIYKVTCLNQYIIALLVFVGLWANIDNIFRILPESYASGKYVIFWLGLAYTFEMASGAAANIIATSKHYRMLTWMVLVTLAIMIVSNLVFIPLYQVSGVALAAAVTTIIFTLFKVLYVYFKYGMQPFNLRFVYLTGIGFVAYFAVYFIPAMKNLVVDILLRSSMITAIYLVLIITFTISKEINQKAKDILGSVFNR